MASAEEDAPLVEPSGEDKILGVREAYARLWAVIKLPAVRRLSVILLTFRYSAPASESNSASFVDLGFLVLAP